MFRTSLSLLEAISHENILMLVEIPTNHYEIP